MENNSFSQSRNVHYITKRTRSDSEQYRRSPEFKSSTRIYTSPEQCSRTVQFSDSRSSGSRCTECLYKCFHLFSNERHTQEVSPYRTKTSDSLRNQVIERRSIENSVNELIDLDKLTEDDVEYQSFKGNIYDAKVLHIYGGNKMIIVFKEYDIYIKWKCVLYKVNIPDIKNVDLRFQKDAENVRSFLRTNFMNKVVKVHCNDFTSQGILQIDIELPRLLMQEFKSAFKSKPEMLSGFLIEQGMAEEKTICYDNIVS